MKTKCYVAIVSTGILTLLWYSLAFSICFETPGGKLKPGSIKDSIPSIIRSYENDVSDGAIFTIQKNSGFYFKICNENEQIRHFMEKWVYPEVADGQWKNILTSQDKSKISIIGNNGIYKVKKDDSAWIVYKYSKSSENRKMIKNHQSLLDSRKYSAKITDVKNRTYLLKSIKAVYRAQGLWAGEVPTKTWDGMKFIYATEDKNYKLTKAELDIPFDRIKSIRKIKMDGDKLVEQYIIHQIDGSVIKISREKFESIGSTGKILKSLSIAYYFLSVGKIQGEDINFQGYQGIIEKSGAEESFFIHGYDVKEIVFK